MIGLEILWSISGQNFLGSTTTRTATFSINSHCYIEISKSVSKLVRSCCNRSCSCHSCSCIYWRARCLFLESLTLAAAQNCKFQRHVAASAKQLENLYYFKVSRRARRPGTPNDFGGVRCPFEVQISVRDQLGVFSRQMVAPGECQAGVWEWKIPQNVGSWEIFNNLEHIPAPTLLLQM